jgi:hypothetical protein
VDAEAHLDPPLVGAATLGDATVVAATDIVNHTPSPQMTSIDRRLKRFTERVIKARQPPLLELPGDDIYGPWRTCTVCAPQEEHVDSGAEPVTYLSIQAR